MIHMKSSGDGGYYSEGSEVYCSHCGKSGRICRFTCIGGIGAVNYKKRIKKGELHYDIIN